MSSDYILVKQDKNGIARITLNRPDIHNAFDDVIVKQLLDVIEKIDADPSVKAVILDANGKTFCAGADLNWMAKMIEFSKEENFADSMELASLMKRLNFMSKPTIVVINGPAFGGGVGLVACCDIAIASPNAAFCLSEVKLGLIPAVISPYVIAAIGQRAARRYFLTAERFDAKTAHQLGLVHVLVKEQELNTCVEQITKTLLNNNAQAISQAKELIFRVHGSPHDDSLVEYTAQSIAEIRVSEQGQKGILAFLAKRNKHV